MSFVELPGEIRNRIYRYLLSYKYAAVTSKVSNKQLCELSRVPLTVLTEQRSTYHFHTVIFRLNKAINYESQDFFYNENKFVVVSSNLTSQLHKATEEVPFITCHASQTISLALLNFRFAGYSVEEAIQPFEITPKFTSIMFPAAYLPRFIACLRVSFLMKLPQSYEIRADITLQPKNRYFGEKEQTTKLLLDPFKKLVRISDVTVVGCSENTYLDTLCSLMKSTPSILPEIFLECERLRARGERLAAEGDFLGVSLVYARACKFIMNAFYFCQFVMEDYVSVLDNGWFAHPNILQELETIQVEFLARRAFGDMCLGNYNTSIECGMSASRGDTDVVRSYLPNLKALIHFYLAEAYLGRARSIPSDGLMNRTRLVEQKRDIHQAELELELALNLDPYSSNLKALVSSFKERLTALKFQVFTAP